MTGRYIGTAALVLALAPGARAMAQDFDAARVEVERVTDGLYVLFAIGEGVIAGNIGVSVGETGVLVIDDQVPALAPKYLAAIGELGGRGIDFAVNTHWHFDHADGNAVLGPAGTWLVAQQNSRNMMMRDNTINLVFQTLDQPAYPPEAMPVISFADRMSFHFNDQNIELLHVGPAHTNGDVAVLFRGDNAVHLGDVFNNAGYPFIDADNGGSLPGMVEFCETVLAAINRDTTVIPGHGPVADYAAFAAYTEMLGEVRARISALIDDGASLEQVIAAQPTAEFDDAHGDPGQFVNRAYTSMTR